MKRVTVIRHAKSGWGAPALSDVERPLNARGRRDLSRVSTLLRSVPAQPDGVLCSSALRTQATLQGILAVWPALRGREQIRQDLYLAPAMHWLGALRELPEEMAHVMLIGHNPGLHELVELLTGTPLPGFPTLAVAHLCGAEERWLRLQPGDFRLAALVSPKHPSRVGG